MRRAARLLLLGGILALLAGMWTGLVRLGWALPTLRPGLPGSHGTLMAAGFLGTLIGLERAAALQATWAFVAPALSAAGALATLLDLGGSLGPALLALGGFGLLALHVPMLALAPSRHTAFMALGAAALVAANVQWALGTPVPRVALWWTTFLILTIAGERLELARLLRLGRWPRAAFAAAAGLLLVGLLFGVLQPDLGGRVAGAAMVGLALWLFRYDIARHTVRQAGLTRFIALCLLPGYGWLAIGGGLILALGQPAAGPGYDAILHSLFLGFTFSLIFGHAPIVLPALLGRPLVFSRSFYLPLGLLHASLALRLAGDLGGWFAARQWGGLLNVAAILLFLLNNPRALRRRPMPHSV
jgi:hypothetical protein